MKTRKDTYKGILQRMRLGNQEDNKGVVIRVGNLSVREELPRLYPGPYNGVHNLVRGCKGEGASTTTPLTPRRGPSRTTYSGGPTWDQACLRRIGILKFGRMSSCKIPFAHYPPRLFAVTQTAISTTIKSKEAGWSILCRLPNPQLGILPQKLDTNFKRELSGGERPRRPRSRPELADFRLEPEDCESRVNDPAVIFSMYSHPSGERDAGSSG